MRSGPWDLTLEFEVMMRQYDGMNPILKFQVGLLFLLICGSSAYAQVDPKHGFFGVDTSGQSVISLFGGTNQSEELGWYFDLQVTMGAPSDKDTYSFSKYTAETVYGDTFRGEKTSFTVIDVGRTKVLFDYIVVYGALGIGSKTVYREYYDKFGILGSGGKYFLKDGTTSGINAQVGLMLYPQTVATPFFLKISYESFIPATCVGAGWAF